VRYLPPNQANDELFFVEEDRHVRADNTFSFKSLRFEAPRHLPERTVQVRFERKSPTQRVVVYYKGERMGEARPLDPVANDRPPRKPGADPDGAGTPVGAHPKGPPPSPAATAQIIPVSEPSTPRSL
jgi:hypothetical protein